jgi:hypothetical protein
MGATQWIECLEGCDPARKCELSPNDAHCEGTDTIIECGSGCSPAAAGDAPICLEGHCTDGNCGGVCEAVGVGAQVDCIGTCAGKCNPKSGVGNGLGAQADGSCQGTCSVQCLTTTPIPCSGACRGTCTGSCTGYQSSTVQCSGACPGATRPAFCIGGKFAKTATSCSLDATCFPSCTAVVSGRAACYPSPELSITAPGAIGLDAADRPALVAAISVLATNLPAILRAAKAREPGFSQAGQGLVQVADTFRADPAKLGARGKACLEILLGYDEEGLIDMKATTAAAGTVSAALGIP